MPVLQLSTKLTALLSAKDAVFYDRRGFVCPNADSLGGQICQTTDESLGSIWASTKSSRLSKINLRLISLERYWSCKFNK